jgi:hypothetical protein
VTEKVRQDWLRRLHNRIRKAYWAIIRRVNRKAYLHHAIDGDNDFESIEELLCGT